MLLLFGCNVNNGNNPVEGDPVEGKAIINRFCVVCHPIVNRESIGPSFPYVIQNRSDEWIVKYLQESMDDDDPNPTDTSNFSHPKFNKKFTTEDWQDVISYINDLPEDIP